jgi:catechol 2,3-dioxygenase-like lactoylglutathione lyase family enzyme
MTAPAYTNALTCVLNVSDLDRAIDWYKTVLGFELEWRVDEIGFAQLNSCVPGVTVGLSVTENGANGDGGATLTWGVADIEAARAAFEAQDVRLDGPIRETPGVVKLLGFYDLDGNSHMLSGESVG